MQEPVTDAKGAGYCRGLLTIGTGRAPGRLNFGGCFAYERRVNVLARLLYIGGNSVKIENRWRGSDGIRHTTS